MGSPSSLLLSGFLLPPPQVYRKHVRARYQKFIFWKSLQMQIKNKCTRRKRQEIFNRYFLLIISLRNSLQPLFYFIFFTHISLSLSLVFKTLKKILSTFLSGFLATISSSLLLPHLRYYFYYLRLLRLRGLECVYVLSFN